MTDITERLPRRGKRRQPRPSDPRRRRVDLRRRRRRITGRVISADRALVELVRQGDVYRVGRQHYLVAPLDADLLETLIVAAGKHEDAEPNGDDEPALSWGADAAYHDQSFLRPGSAEDREDNPGDLEPSLAGINASWLPGVDDQDREGGEGDAEPALGWANEGPQRETLHGGLSGQEDEPELGWSNTGSQIDLAAGYALGIIRESDGDPDAEDDDPGGGNVEDEGEYDRCDDEEDRPERWVPV